MSQAQGATKPRQRLTTPQTLQLMRLEVERAIRHRYPISCMMLGLDGFMDSDLLLLRKRVMPLVFGELKAVTFAHDVRGLGIWTEGFQLAVFPHTDPDVLETLAQELLERARNIDDDEVPDGAAITLSVGISHNLHPGEVSFESLVQDAENGMSVATAGGGNRISCARGVEREIDRLKQELEVQLEEIRQVSESVFEDAVAEEELWGRKLVQSVLELFQDEPDQSEGVVRLERCVIELLRKELGEFRRGSSATQLLEAQNEIARLERRVAKLSEGLGRTEQELRRVASMKDVELGVASIYRTVQGLQVDDDNFEAKKEMLKNIFEANCALRAEMAKKG